MGRTVDQEVHAAFVEFRAKEDDKARDSYPGNNNMTRHTDPVFFSVCPSSASTASRFAQRTPRARSSICSSVLVFEAMLRRRSRLRLQLGPTV